jgi:2-polyprenyl-3-methyl-5-hydroxy-6-metoxy-1,4-benzoquinol methylase
MLIDIECRILRKLWPNGPDACTGSAYMGKSKLSLLLGEDFLAKISGKTVIDFGCGEGAEAIEMARHGARVIGIDVREDILRSARQRALSAGVENRCFFTPSTAEHAEIITSLDSFEHFADPAEVLRIMARLLCPTGQVFVSFGPTWYHPLGGHLFSVFPWAHLILAEEALIRWRSTFKTDRATRFNEVAGGLNQMTIGKFEDLIEASPFQFASLQLIPIRKLRHLHSSLTREFTTAVVRCQLVKRSCG